MPSKRSIHPAPATFAKFKFKEIYPTVDVYAIFDIESMQFYFLKISLHLGKCLWSSFGNENMETSAELWNAQKL